MTITPLTQALGAGITGLDLREPLDADTVRALTEAWREHIVLVFHGQDLDEAAQIVFAG
ncbi:MAG: TauD/TfdA family dioxygenase, partial [Rhodospirillales bacterium]|nr:TauD/TfdA family dioxygenase [Rhodospirillales bacterium]